MVVAAGTMLSACHSENNIKETAVQESTVIQETTAAPETEVSKEETEEESSEASKAQTETEAAVSEKKATLEELWGLLGMDDPETAEMFGGSEENWTEDKKFYIGRIFEVELMGETYPMHTSCDENKVVNAVSVWISNGEREVTEEEAKGWADTITETAGTEPKYDDTSSEAGSKNWKWVFDGKIISLHWMGDLLSINMNPAVGELK